jgi:uncharacterized membrane protein
LANAIRGAIGETGLFLTFFSERILMSKSLFATAAAAAMLSVLAAPHGAKAEDAPEAKMQKCYGVVKAGKNDCGNERHSCAGASEQDAGGDEWVFTPEGLCERLNGGSLEPKA